MESTSSQKGSGKVKLMRCISWMQEQNVNKFEDPPKSAICLDDDDVTTIPEAVDEVQASPARVPVHKLRTDNLHLQCDWNMCQWFTSNYEEFQRHVRNHVADVPATKRSDEDEGEYICLWDICGHKTEDRHQIVRHINYHAYHARLMAIGYNARATLNLMRCKKDSSLRNRLPKLENEHCCRWVGCEEKFDSIQMLFNHIRHHINYSDTKTCSWGGCGTHLVTTHRLWHHVRSHSSEKLIACYHCGAHFANNRKLCDHLRRQNASPSLGHTCSMCPRSFATEYLLREHIRRHICMFACALCDMSAVSLSALADHVTYRHLPNARSHACPHCLHKSVTKSDLRKHILVHIKRDRRLYKMSTNEKESDKEFSSDEDDKFLAQLKSEKTRQRGAENGAAEKGKKYICHLCSKKNPRLFSRGTRLTTHLVRNHGLQWPFGHSRFREAQDVIVIGCGASGIAALSRLHEAGLKVLGLEAANRIGGRVCSVEFGQSVVDIGAAWCHGEKDNIVCELADPLGLLGRPEECQQLFLQSSGDLLQAEDITKALDDAVAAADKDGDGSIINCVQDAAKSYKSLQEDPEISKGFIEWFSRNNHLGGQSDRKEGKSLKGLVESWPCAGEFMLNWKGRGYKTILNVLLKSYPDASKKMPVSILTNKEVEDIRWKCSEKCKSRGLVHVKCKDGSSYTARSVIVTVSVGVLKERHEKLFNPPLPEDKVTALNNLQMCVLDKIYIEFAKPWWKKPTSFNIIWREEDKNLFEPEERWITEIYGFLTVDHQPNVLLAWIYGEGAKEMENASEESVKEGIAKLLDLLFRKQYDVAPMMNIIRTKWSTNRFARGAYAYRSVATEQQGGLGAKTLSEPLTDDRNQPVVCFAGEATSWHRHSAVHGAIEAGFREADRLIDCFKRLK